MQLPLGVNAECMIGNALVCCTAGSANIYSVVIPNPCEPSPAGKRKAQLLVGMNAGHMTVLLSVLVMLSHNMVLHLVPYHGEPCP